MTTRNKPRLDWTVVSRGPGGPQVQPVSLRFEVNGFSTDPADGSTRAGFSASGEINRMDFGVCSPVPIGGGPASDKVRIDIEAGAVLRKLL